MYFPGNLRRSKADATKSHFIIITLSAEVGTGEEREGAPIFLGIPI